VRASLGTLALGDTAAATGTGFTHSLRALGALALEQTADFSSRRAVRAVLGTLALEDIAAATGTGFDTLALEHKADAERAVRARLGTLALGDTAAATGTGFTHALRAVRA
jgi:hypothetical protein